MMGTRFLTMCVVQSVLISATVFCSANVEGFRSKIFEKDVSSNIVNRLNEKEPDCGTITYNALKYLPVEYASNRNNFRDMLQYWKSTCGLSFYSVHAHILSEIDNRSFDEKGFNEGIIDAWLSVAEKFRRSDKTGYDEDHYDTIVDSYFRFLRTYASDVRANTKSNTIEHAVADFYSGNIGAINRVINDPRYSNSKLRSIFKKRTEKYTDTMSFNAAFVTSAWVPLNNASLLGIHPSISIQLGIAHWILAHNLIFGFKFLDSPNAYDVVINTTNYHTAHFFGGEFGYELDCMLIKLGTFRFEVLGTIGLDGFDTIDSSSSKTTKSINALNIGLGGNIKFFFKEYEPLFIGLQFRYNIVNYANPGGTDLSGHTITAGFIIGTSGNPMMQHVNEVNSL